MALKIKLEKEERAFLEEFVKKGTKKARTIARANILLLADDGYKNKNITKIVRVDGRTVSRVKKDTGKMA